MVDGMEPIVSSAPPEEPAPAAPARRGGRGAVLALVALAGVVVGAILAGVVASDRYAASDLPPPVLDGSAGYRFIHIDADSGLPSRFNPCAEVPYVINPAGAPEGAVEDVHEAFRRAELATGIRFVYEGEVDEVPTRARAAYQPEVYGRRWAPVLVGWVEMDPAEREREGPAVGWAAHTPLVSPTRQDVVPTGVIGLDREATSVHPGFGAGRRWGNVVLHEIGHLLGLDHVEDPGQVMATTVDQGAGEWGAGDLAGLAYLGREAGCLAVPAPRAAQPSD